MDFDRKVIEEVQAVEFIWNKKHPTYKNNQQRNLAWKQVAAKLNVSKDKVQSTWKRLQEKFKSCLLSLQENDRSGNGLDDIVSPSWELFDFLTFLRDQFLPASSSGNLDSLLEVDHSSLKKMSKTKKKVATVNIPDNIEFSEDEIENKKYFDNLDRHIKNLSGPQKLLLQNEINLTVYRYAYPDEVSSTIGSFPSFLSSSTTRKRQNLRVSSESEVSCDFDHLVRHLRGLKAHEILLLQNELNMIVFKYSYPEEDISLFQKACLAHTGDHRKVPSKRRKTISFPVNRHFCDDDEIQIIEENITSKPVFVKTECVKQETPCVPPLSTLSHSVNQGNLKPDGISQVIGAQGRTSVVEPHTSTNLVSSTMTSGYLPPQNIVLPHTPWQNSSARVVPQEIVRNPANLMTFPDYHNQYYNVNSAESSTPLNFSVLNLSTTSQSNTVIKTESENADVAQKL